MAFFSLLFRRRLVDMLSRRTATGSRMGRSGRMLANPLGQAIVAGLATMLIKKVLRRR